MNTEISTGTYTGTATTQYIAASQGVDSTMVVSIYLCPSRRTAAAGPMIDYAGAYHLGIHSPSLTNYVNASGYNAVLDTYTLGYKARGNSFVTMGAGTSNTIMAAHKSLQPAHYNPGGQVTQDKGYAWTKLSLNSGIGYDHMRFADSGGSGASGGKGYVQDGPTVDENHFGGPHPGGSPVLFTDGSVRNYSYGYTDGSTGTGGALNDCAVFQALLAYDRTIVVTPP